MNSKGKCVALCIAAALIFLFGIMRGIGGIVNLLSDDNTSCSFKPTSLYYLLYW